MELRQTVLVDTGNSYQGLCNLINAKTHGEDGIYFTYEEDDPIAFNPFYVEAVALSNAVNLFLEKVRNDKQIKPSFKEENRSDYTLYIVPLSSLWNVCDLFFLVTINIQNISQ